MYTRIVTTSFLVVLLCTLTRASVVPQDDPGDHPRLAASLAGAIVPLPDGSPLQWSDGDLRWLDDFADVRILAFGEATHGTREFITARQRILRYLVEKHDYRALVLEAHFTESLFLDRCLADPECDLGSVMQERMLIWTSRTHEMLGLLEWIREYNFDRTESERLHYLGNDSQVRDQIGELLGYLLSEAAPDFLADTIAAMAPLEGLTRADYKQMDDDALDKHRQSLDCLRGRITDADLSTQIGPWETACVLQLITSAWQSVEFLQQYFHHGRLVRDRHLTENVEWISQLFGADTKVVLWAHNAHVAVDRGYAEDADGGMGWQLRERFGDEYRCVALTFNKGEFRAKTFTAAGDVSAEPGRVVFVVDPPGGSLNRLLDTPSSSNYFLDLRSLDANSDIARWLDVRRAVLGVGDLFLGYDKIDEYHYGGDRVLVPLRAFDAIVHFDGTWATESLPHGSE